MFSQASYRNGSKEKENTELKRHLEEEKAKHDETVRMVMELKQELKQTHEELANSKKTHAAMAQQYSGNVSSLEKTHEEELRSLNSQLASLRGMLDRDAAAIREINEEKSKLLDEVSQLRGNVSQIRAERVSDVARSSEVSKSEPASFPKPQPIEVDPPSPPSSPPRPQMVSPSRNVDRITALETENAQLRQQVLALTESPSKAPRGKFSSEQVHPFSVLNGGAVLSCLA